MKDNIFQKRLLENLVRFKDRIALEKGSRRKTYGQLDQESENIACWYRERSYPPAMLVGLLAEDRLAYITGMVGILKAGGVYVALETTNPVSRLQRMISTVDLKILLVDREGYEIYQKLDPSLQGAVNVFNIDDLIIGATSESQTAGDPTLESHDPEDPVYIYFTSGSTGPPKGVLGKNKSLLHYIDWEVSTFAENVRFRFTQFAPTGFDAFAKELFVSMFSGGTLCIPEDMQLLLQADNLVDWLEGQEIDLLHCVPSLFRMLNSASLHDSRLPSLKFILLSGEKIFPTDLDRWYNQFGERIQLVNLYGTTETTILKTYHMLTREDAGREVVPVGKPIRGARAIILDENMQPCNRNIIGEIYIRSPFLADGYYNDESLTRERFIRNPFSENPGDIIYKTGDLGRFLPDGNIECLGRKDRQIKIRGNRVELEEIENVLLKFREKIGPEPGELEAGEENLCKKCLLTPSYPGISLDDSGVCSICREYEQYREKAHHYFLDMDALTRLLDEARREKRGDYDCLLLYSGGKDSSYVLYRLVDMGYKVLTFTFDNGYISDAAFRNIKNTTANLRVENIVSRLDNMNEVFLECLRTDHTVCSGCFQALTSISTRIAYEKGINVVINGLSRGQILETKLEGLFRKEIFDVPEIEHQLKLFRRVYHSRGDRISKLLDMNISPDILDRIHFVDYFRYDDTSIPDIRAYLQKKGWNPPEDTGFCSTNCVINDVGIYVHLQEEGYHNYAAPLSWEVRLGLITRQQGVKEVKFNGDLPTISGILDELGYTERLVNNIHVMERPNEAGENYLCAYLTTRGDISGTDLKEYLITRVPEYMVPAHFVLLDNFPLLSNGKIDVKALPDPLKQEAPEMIRPRDQVEQRLAEIWGEVLFMDKGTISIDANFFDFGGHSLNVMTLISIIYREFDVRLALGDVFNNPTVLKQAEFIHRAKQDRYAAIMPVEKKEYYIASSAQKRLYFLQQIDRQGVGYNVSQVVPLERTYEKKKLEATFRRLIQRHESLRASLVLIDDQPCQRVHDEVEFEIELSDVGGKDPDAVQREVSEIIKRFVRPFDLSSAPFLRVGLIETGLEHDILMYDMHHVIADYVSSEILVREFKALYQGRELPLLRLQYRDYAEWQNAEKQKESIERQQTFWLEELGGDMPILALPLDYPRPKSQSFIGRKLHFEISKEETESLKGIARSLEATMFMVNLAIFSILLSKISGQEDIIIGTPVVGRPHADLAGIIGMLVNTLAIRTRPGNSRTFVDFVSEVKSGTLKAFENQEFQFEDLVESLSIPRDLNRNPVFDVLFTLFDTGEASDGGENAGQATDDSIRTFAQEQHMSRFDLSFGAVLKGKLHVIVEYCTALFKQETVERFIRNYREIVTAVVRDKHVRLGDVNVTYDLTLLKKEVPRIDFQFEDSAN